MERMILKAVGQRVRDIRKQLGLSQEELGEKAGFHFSYIGGVERAEKNITLVNLYKIADALGVPITDLFMYLKSTNSKNASENDVILENIYEMLTSLKKKDLKKVQLYLIEFF